MRLLKLTEADINYKKNYILIKLSDCNIHVMKALLHKISTGKMTIRNKRME